MNIYYFSELPPDPKMVACLGGAITTQFKGSISDIHRRGNQITFTEAMVIGGQTLNVCQLIPAESIVVVEEPLLLQDAWLKAGVATLLIPQMKQEAGNWGSILFKYCGLLQVHQIEVVTSVWSSGTPNTEKPSLSRSSKILKAETLKAAIANHLCCSKDFFKLPSRYSLW